MQQTYSIHGMTCEACVKTVTSQLLAIPEVTSVEVSLKEQTAVVTANKNVSLQEMRTALKDLPKYSASEKTTVTNKAPEKNWLETYKPLLTVFAFIFLVSGAFQLSLNELSMHLFMNHIMAGFFIGLSFFKFLDLKAFAESFSNYDPIAKRFLNYGYVYPFIELGLGLLFISGLWLYQAQIATALLLTVTTFGVFKKLRTKSNFECACLGTSFSLPLSNLTIAENVVMIAMAVYGVLSF